MAVGHADPDGADYAVQCIRCGQVHRTKSERRDDQGRVVGEHVHDHNGPWLDLGAGVSGYGCSCDEEGS
jgi:hypothetical protein